MQYKLTANYTVFLEDDNFKIYAKDQIFKLSDEQTYFIPLNDSEDKGIPVDEVAGRNILIPYTRQVYKQKNSGNIYLLVSIDQPSRLANITFPFLGTENTIPLNDLDTDLFMGFVEIEDEKPVNLTNGK